MLRDSLLVPNLGTDCWPETSVTNYKSTVPNIPEERRSLWPEYSFLTWSSTHTETHCPFATSHFLFGPSTRLLEHKISDASLQDWNTRNMKLAPLSSVLLHHTSFFSCQLEDFVLQARSDIRVLTAMLFTSVSGSCHVSLFCRVYINLVIFLSNCLGNKFCFAKLKYYNTPDKCHGSSLFCDY